MAPQGSASGMTSAFYGLHDNERLHRYVSMEKFDIFMGAGEGRGVFAYQSPNELIAAQLSSGQAAERALRDWCDDVAEKIAIVRRYPRRIVVVENATAVKGVAIKVIAKAFPGCVVPDALFTESEDASGLALFAAALIIRQDPAAFGLLRELLARSPAGVSTMPLLEECLAGIHSEIEGYTSAKAGTAAMAEKLESLERRGQELVAARDLLTKQIVELQSSLQGSVRQLSEANQMIAILRRKVEEIYGSTSWKASAPLRGVKRLISRDVRKGG